MNKAEAIRVLTDMRNLTVWDDEEKGLEVQIEALDVAIKALEDKTDLQLTCNNLATNLQVETSDLISRQAVLEIFCGRCPWFHGQCDADEGFRCSESFIISALEELPSAQQWIPCSERLPEEIVPVNITWVNRNPVSYYKDFKDKPFTATGVYFDGEWYWWSSVIEDLLAEYGRAKWDNLEDKMDEAIEVIAWMPLPEPYRRKERASDEVDCI